jgi:hypothetical protein
MNVLTKKRECDNTTFDAKIREAIFGIGSMSYTEKVDLYKKIIQACRIQVGDCVDVMNMAHYISLHDRNGFGSKRLGLLNKDTQEILDETINKYDTATVNKLRRELEERGFKYSLYCERKK